jgi:hypothetical protein
VPNWTPPDEDDTRNPYASPCSSCGSELHHGFLENGDSHCFGCGKTTPREPDVPLEVVEKVLSEAMRVEDAMADHQSQPSLLSEKRVIGAGRYANPEDNTRPYWVALEWFKGRQPVIQPCSEVDFFKLIHKLLAKYPVSVRVELV